MSLHRIVQKVYAEPWHILPTAHYSIQKILMAKLNGVRHDDEDTDFFDLFAPKTDDYSVSDDGIAYIPLQGTMGRRLSLIEQKCGGCDTEQFTSNLQMSLDNPAVRGLLILADTPGGTHAGTPETAKLIADADNIKPVFFYADGCLASAGMYVAAGARQIYASESSQIGSIGTLLGLLDESEAYKQAGYKVEVFSSGPLKGTGQPGTSLTDEQREYLQQMVNSANDKFQSWIKTYRPLVPASAMQGQAFWADEALDIGLIDAVAPLSQCVEDLLTEIASEAEADE